VLREGFLGRGRVLGMDGGLSICNFNNFAY
jgi:hypothetical protein